MDDGTRTGIQESGYRQNQNGSISMSDAKQAIIKTTKIVDLQEHGVLLRELVHPLF